MRTSPRSRGRRARASSAAPGANALVTGLPTAGGPLGHVSPRWTTCPGAERRADLGLHGIVHTRLLKLILQRVDEVGGGALLHLAKEGDCPFSTPRLCVTGASGFRRRVRFRPARLSRQAGSCRTARWRGPLTGSGFSFTSSVRWLTMIVLRSMRLTWRSFIGLRSHPGWRSVMRAEPRLSRALPPCRCGLTAHVRGRLRSVPDEGGLHDRQRALGLGRGYISHACC